MYHFTSFDEDEFYQAVADKDYIKIKSFVVSAIRNNPSFRKVPGQDASEAMMAIRILEEREPDIFEKYKIQEGEHPFNEEEADNWDEEYFIRQSFLLEENFSGKRLNHLKKIGQKISNFQEPQGQEARLARGGRPGTQVLSQASKPQNRRLTGIAVIAGIILLILIAVLVARPTALTGKSTAAPAAKPAATSAGNPGTILMTAG